MTKTSTIDATRIRPSDLISDPPDELVRAIAKSGLRETKLELINRPNCKVDWLYLFGLDAAPDVRLAVVRHAQTSLDTFIVLARDQEPKIRAATALPLIRGLSEHFLTKAGKNDRLRIKALEILAEDEMAVVRRAVTEAMQATDRWPPELVQLLMLDLDRAVAEPVLISAPDIADADLEKIVESYPPGWVLKAIAQRRQIGPILCGDIVRKKDKDAISALLDNEGAEISDADFEEIVEEAQKDETLQEPLARRRNLPRDTALRLAFFAGERVLSLLQEVQKIDPKSAEVMAKMVADRLRQSNQAGRLDTSMNEAMILQREGVDDERFQGLVAQNPPVARAVLALKARIHPILVDRILDSESPRAVCSLIWWAGLSMRSAMEVQKHMTKIDRKKILNARNGVDYPLSEDQMKWHLSFFGIEDF